MIHRLLIAGLGSIGQRHLRLARQLLPKADIRILRHEPAKTVPDGANGVFSGIEECLAFKPDAAVIANPAPYHVQVAIPLATAGIHLLIEKPISHSSVAAQRLLDICSSTGVVLFTGYNLRFSTSLGHLRNLVHAEHAGRALSVRCEVGQYLPSWRPGIDYRRSVSARAELGGGVLLELSHEIDFLCWIFGEATWVTAEIGHKSSLEVDVEDTAHLLLGFPSLVASLTMDFIRRDATRTCAVICENGTFRWDGLASTVEHYDAQSGKWTESFRGPNLRDETYLAQWHAFLDCIRQRDNSQNMSVSGVQVLRVIEAARQSAKLGRRIYLKNRPAELP